MCLQVRSASSGPRQSDSSFTLENSSLQWGHKGEDSTLTPDGLHPNTAEWPGREAEATALTLESGVQRLPLTKGSCGSRSKGSRTPSSTWGFAQVSPRRQTQAPDQWWLGKMLQSGSLYSEHRDSVKSTLLKDNTNLSVRLQKFIKS